MAINYSIINPAFTKGDIDFYRFTHTQIKNQIPITTIHYRPVIRGSELEQKVKNKIAEQIKFRSTLGQQIKIKPKNKSNFQFFDEGPRKLNSYVLDKIKFYEKIGYHYTSNNLQSYYKAVKDALSTNPNASSLTVHFYNTDKKRVIEARSITRDIIDLGFDQFKTYLDKMVSGQTGSDPINLSEDKMIYDRFSLSRASIKGNGKSDKMIFETVGIESTVLNVIKKEKRPNDLIVVNHEEKNEKEEEEKEAEDLDINNCGKNCLLYYFDRKIEILHHRAKQSASRNNKSKILKQLKEMTQDEQIKKYLSQSEIDLLWEIRKMKVRDLRDFSDIRNIIQDNKLNIDIICNSFTMKKNRQIGNIIAQKKEENTTPTLLYTKNKKDYDMPNLCYKLDIRDIDIIYLYDCKVNESIEYKENDDNFAMTIIYDEFNKHYDVKKGMFLRIRDDIYISHSSKIIKKGKINDDGVQEENKIIFTPKVLNTNSFSSEYVQKRNVFFDYETVIDFKKSSCMQEYSLSILNLTDGELESLTEADIKNDTDAVEFYRRECAVTFTGYDCTRQFIKWILANQGDTAFVFIGFNNSNFDNFILLDGCLRFEQTEAINEFSVSNIFYNGSQLLNFTIAGRHQFFDIHKHIMGSLKDCCKSFKINVCAKKEFDHNLSQQHYENGTLLEFIKNNNELKTYNENDVLATAVLYQKYKTALMKIPVCKPYAVELHKTGTIGSLIYNIFEDEMKRKNIKMPKLTYKHYTDMGKSKIAGRVELFNGVQKLTDRLASDDCCSLYPYILAVHDCYYPCGEIKEVDSYQGDDVIGFYYCDIDQRNLKEKNLPKIYALKREDENDWAHDAILFNYFISNVNIKVLRHFGCIVNIKKGIVFTKKMKSCNMFDFVLDFMKAKNDQDDLSKNNDDKYNPALREVLKLLQNSLTGKFLQGLFAEKTKGIDTLAEYVKIQDKSEKINFINAIGNKLFVTYEMNEEKLCAKDQNPLYIGVLIYDYAKTYMYISCYSFYGLLYLIYTDTDATKIRYIDHLRWVEHIKKNNIIVPHWEEVEKVDPRYKTHLMYEENSKIYGSFEDELKSITGTNYLSYFVEKKSWMYSADNKSKFRFKGLNGSALLLPLQEKFIEEKIINHKSKDTQEIKYRLKDDSQLEVYNYIQKNPKLALGYSTEKTKDTFINNDNIVKFFEQIYTTGESYLLCSSFKKLVRNNARNVTIDDNEKYNINMNKIQVNFMIKHINIYNENKKISNPIVIDLPIDEEKEKLTIIIPKNKKIEQPIKKRKVVDKEIIKERNKKYYQKKKEKSLLEKLI